MAPRGPVAKRARYTIDHQIDTENQPTDIHQYNSIMGQKHSSTSNNGASDTVARSRASTRNKKQTNEENTAQDTSAYKNDHLQQPVPKPITHTTLDIDAMPEVVARANEVKKLLEQDPVGFNAYSAPHLDCPLKFELLRSAQEFKNGDLDTCLGLVEMTSGKDYRASSMGWNVRKKKEEMMDKEMLYILVRQGEVLINASEEEAAKTPPAAESPSVFGQRVKKPTWPDPAKSNRILGFLSFKFDFDDPPYQDRQVVYIYEIHLHQRLRGQGIGSDLFKFVELAAKRCGIGKTMLTVFTANEKARRMYEKAGYVRDECSPADRMMRSKVVKAEYVIMSKELA
jgi:ribosomal protein S18 acetylase RimI-like enzyme